MVQALMFDIRSLSMLELFCTCVANLAKSWFSREQNYRMNNSITLKKDNYNRFIYHQKSTGAMERILTVMHNAEKLIVLCEGTGGDFDDTSKYHLLIRLLKEHTIIDDGSRRSEKRKNPITLML